MTVTNVIFLAFSGLTQQSTLFKEQGIRLQLNDGYIICNNYMPLSDRVHGPSPCVGSSVKIDVHF